jgi:hypothetical protein
MASLLNQALAQTAELRRSVAERMYPHLVHSLTTSPVSPVSSVHIALTPPQSLAEAMYPQLRSNGHVQ